MKPIPTGRLSTKLVFLLILSALIPLLTYGVLSIITSRKAYFQSAEEGNMRVAIGTARQIELYVENSRAILQGLANNINRIYLNRWQKEVMIENYVIHSEGFREISILDQTGREIATGRIDKQLFDRSGEEAFQAAFRGDSYLSGVFISDDLVPSMIIALPIKGTHGIDGVITGKIDLSAMWELVDSITIGKKGVALVVSQSGLLLAHGDHDRKTEVFKQKNLQDFEIVKSVLKGKMTTLTYRNGAGIHVLGVGCPLKLLGWGVIIEQPTKEAFQAAARMTWQLSILMIIFLMLMIIIGVTGGRRITGPIRELIEATRSIAAGDLSRRVKVSSGDELEELSDSFNLMTEKLDKLQEEIRLNERLSIFARIAAGLVHDLKHPIKNIENCSKLILRLYQDEEYRENFHKTVMREFSNINRFLDDLYNLTHPSPIVLIELRLETMLEEIMNLYETEAGRKGIHMKFISQTPDLKIKADKFLFERIIKNLITNAIEAMPQGGLLSVELTRDASNHQQGQARETSNHQQDQARITIGDTGVGISGKEIPHIFTGFHTTKRKGVGLGLALTKKNVSELGGTITVESEEGRGSTFTLIFPSLS